MCMNVCACVFGEGLEALYLSMSIISCECWPVLIRICVLTSSPQPKPVILLHVKVSNFLGVFMHPPSPFSFLSCFDENISHLLTPFPWH